MLVPFTNGTFDKWLEKTTRWIRLKYAYYYDDLQRLGQFPITKDITIKELKLSDTIIKTGYRDKKKIKFDGTLIEFLMYVSMSWILLGLGEQELRARDEKGNPNPDYRNMLKLISRRPDLYAWHPYRITESVDITKMVYNNLRKHYEVYIDLVIREKAEELGLNGEFLNGELQ